MTLKTLLITGIACTLIAGQSYAQTSQNIQTENKNKSNNNTEQNQRATPYIKLGDIKGESTKRVSGNDCDDSDANCKSLKKRPGRVKYGNITLKRNSISNSDTDSMMNGADGKRVGRNPQTGATIKP